MSCLKITPALVNKEFKDDILETIVSMIIESNGTVLSENDAEDTQIKEVLRYVWRYATKTLFPLSVATTLREFKKDLVKENYVELRNQIFFNMAKFAIGAIAQRFRNSTGMITENIIKTNLEVSCFVLGFNIYHIVVKDGKDEVNTASFDDMPVRVLPEDVFKLFEERQYQHNREFMLLMDTVYSDPKMRKALKESVEGPLTVEEAQKSLF